jgi:hypothetical protein
MSTIKIHQKKLNHLYAGYLILQNQRKKMVQKE